MSDIRRRLEQLCAPQSGARTEDDKKIAAVTRPSQRRGGSMKMKILGFGLSLLGRKMDGYKTKENNTQD